MNGKRDDGRKWSGTGVHAGGALAVRRGGNCDASTLRELGLLALARAGVLQPHAETQIDLLLDAKLRGVPSHGLLRLERIIRRIGNGVTDPNARGDHRWLGPAFLAVDGGRGLGPVVANAALDAVAARAEETGVAVAAIRNSNHVGMLGWYAERLAGQGFTVIALSMSEALVHPWGAGRAMIGTNPIAIGIPTGGEPLMMDMATSVVSMGEIHDHALRRAPLQAGWALDAEAAKTGSIAPFGQAKGYALGLAFELLVASLAGAALGRDVRGTLDDIELCNKGDVFIVIKGQQRNLQAYLADIRATEPADGFGEVLIPGERGRACRRDRLRVGVPVAEEVWKTLHNLAGAETAA